MRTLLTCLACIMACSAATARAGPVSEAITWQAALEVAAGNGEKGPWRQNDSRYDYVDDPAIAINDEGNVVIAWADQKRKDILVRRIAAENAKRAPRADREALNVSRSPGTFSWLPRIVRAPGPAPTLYLVWQEIIFSGASHGGEIFFARSDDGGKSFGAPVNVSRSEGGDGKGRISRDVWHNGSYDLAVGPDGGIYMAWTEYDGMLWFARSTDGGKLFSAPRQIAGSRSRPARGPSVAVGKDGLLYLAWTTGENASADIELATSLDYGASFGAPQTLAQSPAYSDAPSLAVDPQGRLHLAYAESDGDALGNYHVRYLRSSERARGFEAPREISAPIASGPAGAAFPSLAVGADGTVILSWELFPSGGGRPRGLGIAVSRNGGQTFTSPGIVPESADPGGGGNGSHQGLLMEKLALNAGGTVAIVNSSMKPGLRSRVWLMRGQLAK